MSSAQILDKYTNRKAKGLMLTEVTQDGKVVVFRNIKTLDEDDNQTIVKTVVLTTTAAELRAEITALQDQKQILNAFLTAEGL